MKKENRIEGKFVVAISREEVLGNDNTYSTLCCRYLLKMKVSQTHRFRCSQGVSSLYICNLMPQPGLWPNNILNPLFYSN